MCCSRVSSLCLHQDKKEYIMLKPTLSAIGITVLVLNSAPAFAYIDPGSGSFIIQMLIASLLGAGITIKMYYRNIKQKLSDFFSKDSKDNDDKQNPDSSTEGNNQS